MGSTHDAQAAGADRASRIIQRFERVIVLALMAFLTVVITLSTLELGWLLVRDLMSARMLLLDVEQMFELFGFFLLVLIGMELLATLKSYLYEPIVHVEVVLEVALIALAQKVIIVDLSRASPPNLFGLAGLIVSLALAMWCVRRRRSAVVVGGAGAT